MEAGVGSGYVRPSKVPAMKSSRLALRELASALISTRPRSFDGTFCELLHLRRARVDLPSAGVQRALEVAEWILF
jgi:hypothetical protein